MKIAYDAAAKKAGGFPTQDQVIEAMKGAEFESFSTNVKMALGNGHQAITENGYGITKWDAKVGRAEAGEDQVLSGRLRQPARGRGERRVDQGRHEGRQVQEASALS